MIDKNRAFLCYIFILSTHVVLFSQSNYYTYLNDFRDFRNTINKVENKVLIDVNNSTENRFNLIDFDCSNEDFSISMRIANKRNISGKTYKVYDNKNKSHKVNNPCWGLIWNYQDNLNYKMIKLRGHNSMLYDILDERSLIVDVISVCSGNVEILKTEYLKKGVNLYDGFNNLWVKSDKSHTYLYVGNNRPILIDELKDDYVSHMKVGYFIGPGSKIEMEIFKTYKPEATKRKHITSWQKSDINNYLKKDSIERIEGIWTYLDRNIDETFLKLGGRYQLVVIKDEDGSYNIMYYDGADVNCDEWSCGMLKGRLCPTRFKNNYQLIWYDSSFEEMNDDTYATIDEDDIMTLYFPNEKGQIRFVKK